MGGVCLAAVLCAQVRRPLVVNQSRYTVAAGQRLAIDAPSETLAFMKSAKTRTARAPNRTFPVAPDVPGDQVLLGVPLTTEPGDYTVAVSFTNDAGEERGATFQLTVEPFPAPAAASAVPPVVLLDGFQVALTSSCPMSSDSTGTFDNLASYLQGSPNNVPTVYFFENCTECPNCSIEQLGADLGTFLNSLPAPQVDVVAHSMGGLIVRSYLAGKQVTSGAFSPPAKQKIRKAVFLGTPHFGSFQADSALAEVLLGGAIQAGEMKRASQFLWDLATWNQFGDDLRGVDAVAVIGNAGPSGLSDGVVGLSSASLDFARPARTRVIDACHISPDSVDGLAGIFLSCTAPGIAYIDTPSHPSYEVISSFLMSGTAWQSIGNAPAGDPILSQYGGMVVADVTASDQFVGGLTAVSWGTVALTNGAASGEIFYDDFVNGTGSFSFGASTCGPYTQKAGIYSTVRCKSAPAVYSVGPILTGSAKLVPAGAAITIAGAGFGAQQCSTCGVTASNPAFTALAVSNWSDTSITAFLPTGATGLVTIGVTAANGADAIDIMAATPAAAPAIALSASNLSFAFTIGGTTPAPQTVSISLAASVASNVPWLTATPSGSAITVAVNPSGLAANTYLGEITVTAAGATNSPQTISVALAVSGAVSSVAIGSVSNSAAGFEEPVAPGEIVSIYGTGLGPATGTSFSVDPATGMVDTTLAGTRVLIGSVAAPILYTSTGQINAVAPYEIAGQSEVAVEVQYQGAQATRIVQVANASPAAYTANSSGSGPVAALNQDGTINGPSNPAAKGSYVTIYFTGGGQTNPPGVTGSVTGSVLKWLTQSISVTVGNQPATVTFDGSAPTFVDGADQLNIQLSPNTPSGAQAVVITVGGIASPASGTLAVQ